MAQYGCIVLKMPEVSYVIAWFHCILSGWFKKDRLALHFKI